jgi:SSS family solute:Na+ symporter
MISPCLRRPLSTTAKLLLIRSLVVALGLFLLFYGLWYKIPGTAWDYIAVTGTMYLASIFALLVGALYWPWANRWGAYAALALGVAGPLAFLLTNTGARQWIAPEVAGLSGFALAFAGMFFGSLAGRFLGSVDAPAAADNATPEVKP